MFVKFRISGSDGVVNLKNDCENNISNVVEKIQLFIKPKWLYFKKLASKGWDYSEKIVLCGSYYGLNFWNLAACGKMICKNSIYLYYFENKTENKCLFVRYMFTLFFSLLIFFISLWRLGIKLNVEVYDKKSEEIKKGEKNLFYLNIASSSCSVANSFLFWESSAPIVLGRYIADFYAKQFDSKLPVSNARKIYFLSKLPVNTVISKFIFDDDECSDIICDIIFAICDAIIAYIFKSK